MDAGLLRNNAACRLRRWGRPSPHVIDTFHHPQDANILILSNVFKDNKPTGLVDAGTYFRTDYSYLDDAARCTILHALDVPPAPHGTTFAAVRGERQLVWD